MGMKPDLDNNPYSSPRRKGSTSRACVRHRVFWPCFRIAIFAFSICAVTLTATYMALLLYAGPDTPALGIFVIPGGCVDALLFARFYPRPPGHGFFLFHLFVIAPTITITLYSFIVGTVSIPIYRFLRPTQHRTTSRDEPEKNSSAKLMLRAWTDNKRKRQSTDTEDLEPWGE